MAASVQNALLADVVCKLESMKVGGRPGGGPQQLPHVMLAGVG